MASSPCRSATLPFTTTEDAWFWTVGSLRARREGGGSQTTPVPRPCDPDDVLLCIDRLYRDGKIELSHARVLRCWGDRQIPPQRGATPSPNQELSLWREAMACLQPVLEQKGIVIKSSRFRKSVVDMHTRV
jgi:hypothetical protein